MSAPASAADLDALRQKYAAERDRRLRTDGNGQYVEIDGSLARFVDDPFAGPTAERAPLTDAVDVAIVGGGFSGLLAGARLREVGLERIRIVESGADVGGTWYWNRYPGAQCDIESYIYLPLLEEIGYVPTEKYAHGPEIYEHARAIAAHFELVDDACFSTQVTEMVWDDTTWWTVHTDRGDAFTARFVIMAIGPLSRPKLPGIPGVETFAGHTFHTSRWDYGYTGGGTDGNLTGLTDKVVGIIGTGATAVQCIPHLGESAKHLYVFQRTPSSIDERRNRVTDPEWVASLEPGWQQRRIDNFGTLVSGGFQDEDLVADGWTDIIRNLSALGFTGSELTPEEIEARVELADARKMDEIRARVDAVVVDPATAEALKPWYRQFCKRPCFHDDYLPTFNRPNVTLVDTVGRGVERITPEGVVVDGTEYPLDCLIFATGFEVGTAYTRRAGCEVVGRDGVTLTEKWNERVATFQGLVSRGFPNCFIMGGIQSGITPNFTELYNEQSRHIAHIVERMLAVGATTVEPTEDAEHDWVSAIEAGAGNRQGFQEACTPGYYNNEGRPGEGPGWFGGNYGGGAPAFFSLLRDWRAAGSLDGLELGREESSPKGAQ
ncbi:MAG: NAD(P)/FAD-dependent oxidoreductase [Acidimicrobiales bacterium]|nr:NAD(P)/FAD-dependent oxidoreductase [Acidimicrobiales bacterium]